MKFECREHTVVAGLLVRTLKHHRVVAVNMALADTSTMRLQSQKAKKCAGSSHTLHITLGLSFPSYILSEFNNLKSR